MSITVYHNPRCTKSRQALEYLDKKKKKHEIVLYLKEGLKKSELKDLLVKLDLKAEDILRKGEKIYKEKYADQKMTEAKILKAIMEEPRLLQRPIIIKGKKAVIGRPTEAIDELL